MLSILDSFGDLAVSVFEVISSVCETTFNMLYELLRRIINFFIDIPEMALHVVKGLSEIFGGVGRFVTGEPLLLIMMNYCVNNYPKGNVVAIAIIAGGFYGYLKYQRRQWYPAQNRAEKPS